MLDDKNWLIPEPVQIPDEFKRAIGGHPLVAETLFKRGLQDISSAQAFLNPDFYQPCSPDELPDSQAAYILLSKAIRAKKHILVWGDFDVDGQTSTIILVQGLRELGGQVSYHIPIRGKESHGISREVLDKFLRKGFDLLITCDTGISEHETIQYARQSGIPVIVTDHHTLSETLPPANAVVNPQRLPEDHPLRTLPGVGVAYKVMEGLFAHLQRDFRPGDYLDLVALGIVADVADQHGDTRYLLQKGLRHLRTTTRIGLRNLFEKAKLNYLNINEDHIGFQIAPRLNAVGRLGDANPIIEFLTTEDTGRARVLAAEIEAMNTRRRSQTRQVERAALSQLESSPDDRHAPAIILHHPSWPGGIVGIVASRLVERYQKPVILLTGEDPFHGSARSVKGINITEAIRSQAKLLRGFGGHPMAAGLSLTASNYNAFKRGFLSSMEAQFKDKPPVPAKQVDHIIRLNQITIDLVEQIERLAPFGSGYPKLEFMLEDLKLVSTAIVGNTGEHRQIIAEDADENQCRFIWWNGGDEPLPEAEFDLISTLSKSDYRGETQINAVWVDYRLSEHGQETLARENFEIIDHRNEPEPGKKLKQILEEHTDTVVWAEGIDSKSIPSVRRHELEVAENLVIWTTPPSNKVLKAALQITNPRRVFVFGQNPGYHITNEFLTRLLGLGEYAINHKSGQAPLIQLASACGSEEETIQVGLRLLAAMGKIGYEEKSDIVVLSDENEDPNPETIEILSNELRKSLEESWAYRKYFRSGDIKEFLYVDNDLQQD